MGRIRGTVSLMIRITVELVSAVDKSRSRVLGVGFIWNDGKGSPTRASYGWQLMKAGTDRIWKSGTLADFPRTSLGGWDLLFRALKAAVGDRNP